MLSPLLRFVVVLLALPTVAVAVEQPLTGYAIKWSAGAGGKSKIALLSQHPLSVEVTVGGGPEGFPSLHLGSATPFDFRGYQRIAGEVLLESADPGVRSGGKNFALVLSDDGYRHESIEGKPTRQQTLPFRATAGEWQPLSIDITRLTRAAVVGLDLYLYDMPYNYPHGYKVSFRNLRVVGADAGKTHFDGASFPSGALKGSAAGAATTLQTADGLSLTLAQNGGVLKLAQGDVVIGEGKSKVSGVLVRDVKTDVAPVMIGGQVKTVAGGFEQSAELPAMQLKVEARYRAEPQRVCVDGKIESTSPDDRAVTVYVALPIAPSQSWRWHHDLNRSLRPFAEQKEAPTLEETITTFPLAVLSDTQQRRSVALLLDQQRPVQYRLAMNPREGLLYAAFDFALIDEPRSDGRSLREAEFHVEIAATDAAWGFRSGVEKLYQLHPENFVDRVGHGGGWELDSSRRRFNNTPEERLAGGYRFDWSALEINREQWEWNAKHNVENVIYIEPDFFQFSLGDMPAPTTPDVQSRMTKLLAGDEAEWAKFLPLHYSQAAIGTVHLKNRDLRTHLTKFMASQQVSLMHDRTGEPLLGLGYRPGWIGDSGFGSMSPANLAPNIPGGRGALLIDEYYKPIDEALIAEGWTPLDGFGLDSFMDVPHDYRRENFRHMRTPLAFESDVKLPMVPRAFGAVEWIKELRRRFEPRPVVTMANCFGPMTFAVPALDVFGLENSYVSEPQLYRVLAGPKRPITFLPYDPPSQAILDYHLFWGVYPGRNVTVEALRPMVPVLDALYQAAWQPVTGVRTQTADIQIERFGAKEAESIYITVHNAGTEDATVELRLDPARLGARKRAQGIYNDTQAYSLDQNKLRLPLKKLETKALRLDR